MTQRTVVIKGAPGAGRATARRFARGGADVAILARGSSGLEATAAEIEDAGGRALPLQVDVSDGHAVAAAADKIEQALGPIDVWVNNAMATVIGPVRSLDFAEVERVSAVTYLGVVNGTLVALERMRTRDRGTMVQVGSALAYRSIPLHAWRGSR